MPETNAFLSHSCSWELAWLEFPRSPSPIRKPKLRLSRDTQAAHSHTLPKRLVIPWECMLLYDSLVLVLTVMKTYRMARDDAASGQATSTVHIPTLILRDGHAGKSKGFAAFRVLIISQPLLRGTLASFNSVIGVILVSRMVLNLRGVRDDAREDWQPTRGHPQIPTKPRSRGSSAMELSSISPILIPRNPLEKMGSVYAHEWREEFDDFGPVVDISRSYQIEVTDLGNGSHGIEYR
ncbi:hypothetical protein HWV62_12638 [Athelia sp. TMB]|nr:hypothetical protein HWV62_12638 [Athelia sp. TMB]